MAGLFYGGIKLEVITGGSTHTPENNVAILYVDGTNHINVKDSYNNVISLAHTSEISSMGMAVYDGRYITVSGGYLLGQLVLSDTASIIPESDNAISLGTSGNRFSSIHANDIHVGAHSLYVNGKEVLSDNSGTITVSTDTNQHLDIKTTGSGILKVESDQEVLILTNGSAKDVNLQASGNVNAAGNNLTFTGNGFGLTLVNPNAATINTNIIETTNHKGAANGYAELDSNSKIPIYRIPDSLIGAVEYQGGWAASVNIPTIVAATSANKGWYYVTATAVASGHGYSNVPNVDFQVGDWIISNGSTWQKIDNTDAVVSVFGRIGGVTAISGDYTASQIMVTPAGNITSINVQGALQELDNNKASSSIIVNQATQIAAISGQNISQASQIATISAASYSTPADIYRTEVAAISAGINSHLSTDDTRLNNHDTLISIISAVDANQATQISAISGSILNLAAVSGSYATTSYVHTVSANLAASIAAIVVTGGSGGSGTFTQYTGIISAGNTIDITHPNDSANKRIVGVMRNAKLSNQIMTISFASSGNFTIQDAINGTDYAGGSFSLHSSGGGTTTKQPSASMTSDIAPAPFVASASDEYSNLYPAWQAFDNGSLNWIANPVGGVWWLKIDLGAANAGVCQLYGIKGAYGYVDDPRNWQFQGSNDGSSWTVLDTQVTNYSSWTGGLERQYSMPNNTTSYRYYRLYMTVVGPGGDGYSTVGELLIYISGVVYTTNTSYYIATNSLSSISLANISVINSISSNVATPTNTSAAFLFSFDGRTTWKYWNGSAWTVAGDGTLTRSNIDTYGTTFATAQGGFPLTVSSQTNLDFAVALKSTASVSSPTISSFSINYNESDHYDTASVGTYQTSGNEMAIRIVSSTVTRVKNMMNSIQSIYATVVTP